MGKLIITKAIFGYDNLDAKLIFVSKLFKHSFLFFIGHLLRIRRQHHASLANGRKYL